MRQTVAILNKLGLSKDAGAVYLVLVESPPLGVSEIARRTGDYRPAIYRALAELLRHQLVTASLGNKRKAYSAEPPERLRELLKSSLGELDDYLPALAEKYAMRGRSPLVRVLEGKKGIARAFADVVDTLPKGGTFYRISAERDLARTNAYLPKDYRDKRDAKKLERFVITTRKVGEQKKSRMERAMKYFPKSDVVFDQDTIELIYGDSIALLDLNTETALIVESPQLAEFQKKLFRLLYQRL
jgi:HTH-type transcriptional regulator, sugar sensing transcriptional regulator